MLEGSDGGEGRRVADDSLAAGDNSVHFEDIDEDADEETTDSEEYDDGGDDAALVIMVWFLSDPPELSVREEIESIENVKHCFCL